MRKKWLISKKKGFVFLLIISCFAPQCGRTLEYLCGGYCNKIIATVEGSGELASLQILPLITDQVYFI